MSEMTVVEAYIKFSGQLVILTSGLPGCNKNKLSKEIAGIFKIKYMSLREFLKKDYDKEVVLSNGSKAIDWDNNDAYDWEKFNNTVDKIKSEGIIISGFAFPTDLIKFKVDAHINIKISKKQYTDSRHKYLHDHKDSNKELFELIDTPTESLIINKLIYPHYIEYTQASTITKYINTHEIDYNGVFDQAFDYLIFVVQRYLEQHHNHSTGMHKQEHHKQEHHKQEHHKQEHHKQEHHKQEHHKQERRKNTSSSSSDSSTSTEEPYILATIDPKDPFLKYIQ